MEITVMEDKPLAGLRIGIFGKGGAGKSTVTVFLAGALQALGYSVVVLDADSTNVGLAAALGIEREPLSLLEYFGGMVFSGGRVTCPVDDPTPLSSASLQRDELPWKYVARNPDGVELLVAGKLGALGPGAGCDGPIAKIARDVRVRGLGPCEVTLIDYKAGFEDSARGAVTSLDWVLAVVDPTMAAVQLAINLRQMISEVQAGVPPATRHLPGAALAELAVRLFRESPVKGVVVVLNRISGEGTESEVRKALGADDGPRVVGAFAEDPAIQDQWLRGRRLESGELCRTALTLVRALEAIQRDENFAGAVAGDRRPTPSGNA
jgi:CO dehydrogenase nickel-insertion accessory protein CooC1